MAFKLFDKLSSKGQLSVEFILILLVVLILIQIIVLPLRDYSEASIKDMTNISYLESNVNKIQQAIADLNTYSEGKLEVNLHIPEDSNFSVFAIGLTAIGLIGHLNYSYSLNSSDINNLKCVNNVCENDFSLGNIYISNPTTITIYKRSCTGEGIGMQCILLPIIQTGLFFQGPSDQKIIIEKNNLGNIVISK
jgi:hypothetical protein